ncbi:MAG: MarR family winged helix-turn-helix transcriptional regulator [Candidatus Falkowbacteria bacterium]
MTSNRQELLKNLIDKMTRAIHNMNSVHEFPFGDCMLKKQQIMILFFIYDKKSSVSVKDIAKFLHVTSGAITQFVDGLVERKLVKREENQGDRRVINIKLTPSTEKQFNNFKNKYIISASKSFSQFTDKEIEQLTGLLEKIKTPKV